MCRLLAVRSKNGTEIGDHLREFADISRNSKNYQGHGWGFSYLDGNNEWQHYKNIKPVWDDNFDQFGRTRLLLAHSRNAYRKSSITIENNMPFYTDDHVFIFNGLLSGVDIVEEGRIGAEKIFNLIQRFTQDGMDNALKQAVTTLEQRTKEIIAMNIIIADKDRIYLSSMFSYDPEYFTMHLKKTKEELVICSDPYIDEDGWEPIPNRSLMIF
ncbi:class II glutamine amidotransferase [Candidatus Woesearchaeota archaeon]|nr:class II glutamine amidotransferase [Candidatus Woesearchaeota archaeon]